MDSHGQSEIGSGVTRLLNVGLLPRIKQINRVRLYRPNAGEPGTYSNLQPALTRRIRWDVINANYDQVIKYATAIRTGTASTEAILSRFTRAAAHPAYQAMLEIGRAQRTLVVARYLLDRDRQREIEEELNVTNGGKRWRWPRSVFGSSRRRWCTSTPSCPKRSSPRRSGPASSPTPTGAA